MLNSFRLFVLAAFAIGFYFAYNDPVTKERGTRAVVTTGTVPSACNNAGQLAITFDEGPHNTHTPPVLDALKTANIKATFHVTTSYLYAQLTSNILKRTFQEGHVIGLRYMPSQANLSTSATVNEVIAQAGLIYNAIGVYPKFLRLPFGTSNNDLTSTLSSLGYQLTSWNIDPTDYLACNATSGYKTVDMVNAYVNQFKGFKDAGTSLGSFIPLHHDICDISVALPQVIEAIKTYGYTSVPLNTCLGMTASYKQSADKAGDLDPSAPTVNTSTSNNNKNGTPNNNSGTTSNTSGGTSTNAGTTTTVTASSAVTPSANVLVLGICLAAVVFNILF